MPAKLRGRLADVSLRAARDLVAWREPAWGQGRGGGAGEARVWSGGARRTRLGALQVGSGCMVWDAQAQAGGPAGVRYLTVRAWRRSRACRRAGKLAMSAAMRCAMAAVSGASTNGLRPGSVGTPRAR